MDKIKFNQLNEYVAKLFNGFINQNFIIINFNDKKNLKEFVHYQKDAGINITNLSNIAETDCLAKKYDVINFVENNISKSVIYGLSTHFKLQGRDVLYNFIKDLAEDRTYKINSKLVFVLYDMEPVLSEIENKYIRTKKYFVYIDDTITKNQRLFFADINENINSTNIIDGLNNIGDLEIMDGDVYCKTLGIDYIDIKKSLINFGIYEFDCYKEFFDKYTCKIDDGFTDVEKIKQIYNKFSKEKFDEFRKGILYLISKGKPLNEYEDYNELEKYLFLIIAQEYSSSIDDKSYFKVAISGVYDINDLENALYNKIVDYDVDDDMFTNYFIERYNIFKSISTEKKEMLSRYYVINKLYDKQQKIIYYLTDLTRLECDRIIEYITENKIDVDDNRIKNILKTNYKDLYSYLQNDNSYLINGIDERYINNYIRMYKKQKITNTIDESFIDLVEEQANKHEFINIDHRSRVLSKLNIDKEKDFIVFFDALGIEYLNFIIDICKEKDVYCDVYIGKCNLPSETEFNKEFLELAKNTKFSDIDDIVHEQCIDTMNEKSKIPIYINKQLSCIKSQIINVIYNYLTQYKNIYIIADHGSSRLAKIYNKKKEYNCEAKGESGGRFVEYDVSLANNEIIYKETQKDKDYAIITNYDKFAGGRMIGNEVHGGATLEEILVPIIKLSLIRNNESNYKTDRIVKLKNRQDLLINVYGNVRLKNISFRLKTSVKEYDGNIIETKETNGALVYNISFGKLERNETGTFELLIYNDTEIYDRFKIDVKRAGITKNYDF